MAYVWIDENNKTVLIVKNTIDITGEWPYYIGSK